MTSFDAQQVDVAGFLAELKALQKEIRDQVGPEDLAHLKKIERWGRACTLVGYATAPICPNPLSAALISQGRVTRWAMVAHHCIHNGYKRVPDVPKRYTRAGFAKGARRFVDWFDVIQPAAWHDEHDTKHHPRTGELEDPDLVEVNLDWLRDADWPLPVKYAIVTVLASSWKWIYYAPNTLKELSSTDRGIKRESLSGHDVWNPLSPNGRRLWAGSYLPYASWHFVALPLLFSPLGPLAVFNVAANSILAELFTNLHTFLIIVTNHVGEDLARFEDAPADKDEWYLRQILSSTNYATGSDFNDFLHGWLNYQIEHHLWPEWTMLQYKKAQPRLKALCEAYGVPYVQESVFTRLRKTVDVMVGKSSMAMGEREQGALKVRPVPGKKAA